MTELDPLVIARVAAWLRRNWRPIESAPGGGRWVLVWWEQITDCALVAYKVCGKWRCPLMNGYYEGAEAGSPTHWMPLPAGPTDDTEGDAK